MAQVPAAGLGRLAELAERRIVVDTRNLRDSNVLRWVGFEVCGVGRSSVG
jgi:hypothetical protein